MAPRKNLGKDEEIKIFYDYGLHIPTRKIIVESVHVDVEGDESGVDASMWSRLEKGFVILENWPLSGEQDNTITIVMNNPGGHAYHMFGMYDRIRSSHCPVVMEASGMVMSAASVIFQAADKRKIHWNATMMIHFGESGVRAHAKVSRKWADESERIDGKMSNVFLARIHQKHPRFTLKDLEDKMNFDWFLSANEAVEWGLADEIIPYFEKEIE